MSRALVLCLILPAAFALTSALLSTTVIVLWRTSFERAVLRSNDILTMRMLPSAGAMLLVLTVVLPAFLVFEPRQATERVGPVIWALAAMSLAIVGDGMRRGWNALVGVRSFVRHCGPVTCTTTIGSHPVAIVELPEPLVAVVGGVRPIIIAARRVVSSCSPDELHQIVAHEVAHMSVRDNLKGLLLAFSPDVLAWLPTGTKLVKRWRLAAEFDADQRATGSDPRRRVALASALIKVARLATDYSVQPPILSMPVVSDDVEGRVRQLLAPPPVLIKPLCLVRFGVWIGSLPLVAIPLYRLVQQFIESLVTFGR